MSAIKALQQWCEVKSSGYRDVNVTNMTTSFRDGLAFCALIHKHKPDLIDFDSLKKEDVFYNNQLAFRVAEEKLGIPALLDAEDMVALRIPDRLSILTYVSQYYNYFNGRCPIGGMGGIKRPAEGSKEEPSEKKNLPVVRTATEIPTHSCTVLVKTAPRAVALDKEVLVASTNKIATLGSKCVVCKCHVHLVQRHFIEGRLYHRSCFRCCECSKVLLAGAYKPYGESGSFICSHHRSSCRPPSPVSVIQTVPPTSTVDPKSDESVTNSASALLIPIAVTLKPTAPAAVPDPQPWTSSAQKTQAARQRFFQSSHSAPARTLGSQKPMISSSIPKVSLSVEEDKVRARAVITKKLAEANRNNNNTRYFVVRPAERLSDVPRSAELLRAVPTEHGPTTATQPAAQSSARSSADKESRLLDADKASAKPTTISSTTKGKDADRSEAPGDWRSKLKPVQKGRGLYPFDNEENDQTVVAETYVVSESSATSVNVHSTSPRAPSAAFKPPPPKSPPLSPPSSTRSRGCSSADLGTKNGNLSTPPLVPVWHRVPTPKQPRHNSNESGSKNGGSFASPYSPKSEMRSPSARHIPRDQMVKELRQIEDRLGVLERKGVEMEERLRSCEEEGEGDILMDPLMVDWFNLIREKQIYIRRASELTYTAKTQDLEEQQPGVEGELRRLLETPDHLKSAEERLREDRLMGRLMEIVNSRNAIVDGLDEDRLREEEEDRQLNEIMQTLGLKKSKVKKSSSFKNLFRRRSCKLVMMIDQDTAL